MPTIKIALLLADTPADVVKSKYGDYLIMFTRVFKEAAAQLNTSGQINDEIKVEMEGFDVVTKMEYPPSVDTYDAILISGSKYSAYENLEWILKLKDYVRKVVKDYPKLKLIGICFGHQIIAEALGGKVSKNPKGWEVGFTEMEINQEGQRILRTTRSKFALNEMHQDAISELPEGFVTLASNGNTQVQAMVKDKQVVSVQAHPEFVSGVVDEIINLRLQNGVFKSEQASHWRSLLTKPNESLWFTKKLIGFILEEKVSD